MRKRAAIYARFSSDRQKDRSIDDQVALCQALADRNSWAAVTMIYADFAASGSTVHRRPEFSRMLADAEDHRSISSLPKTSTGWHEAKVTHPNCDSAWSFWELRCTPVQTAISPNCMLA